MKKIGILGGGQLGMLLAQSIVRHGAEALIYDPDPQAPACRSVRTSINSNWQDKHALSAFLSQCDAATYEFENIPHESLAELNHTTPIYPSLDVLKITQNRANEKAFLKNNSLPHVPYIESENISQLEEKINSLIFPIIIKSTTGGYDGKSQLLVKTKENLIELLSPSKSKKLPSFPIIAEHAINLYMEASCITALSKNGEKSVFPVFENVHTNHILDTTTVPANIPPEITAAIQKLALQASVRLGVTGILCTEFFITRKESVVKSAHTIDEYNLYINEFAPRPHNSGHVTISSCNLSQFDALSRILLDIPIGNPVIHENKYFCMANLLGDIWLDQSTEVGANINLSSLNRYKDEAVEIILYGKEQARSGRKMGHLVTCGPTLQQAKVLALQIRDALNNSSALK